MNKLLFSLLLTLSLNSFAELKLNPATNKYYSLPNHGINQEEYNNLFLKCREILLQFLMSGKTGEYIAESMRIYLSTIGTPTAARLWSDIKEFVEKQ